MSVADQLHTTARWLSGKWFEIAFSDVVDVVEQICDQLMASGSRCSKFSYGNGVEQMDTSVSAVASRK